ncbi:SGNH/GDSL hydrolase family protein [Streptomyces sp. B1866]|uniref:SGNH/GDSL hydrolase family protein n=1 Tax=Streptomyces sp. B1866 TaxID=3075431 RepID=UPI00288E5848|nr:SGNH/GDSL hydrolase family protein [Streptomyces sp. B1866]MDT3398390.1 SGNH/GDSL hydrolase family protein [Streptomyces sp. B1866]
MRSRAKLALTTAVAAAALLAPTVANATAGPAAGDTYQRYVALGDSYASMGSLTEMYTDPDTGCIRSHDNYPAMVKKALSPAAFMDATCAGAVTADVLDKQLATVTPDTDLVTLSIGGNDIGFAVIALTCGSRGLVSPFGHPCQDYYNQNGTDQIAETIALTAPKIDAVLAAITQRAPHAKVVVAGYLRLLPVEGGCWPSMPIADGDVRYLTGVQDKLNAMIADRAKAAGATFVNPGEATGHDACQLPWNRWIDGVLPLANGTPVHPTAAGQRHVTELITSAL